MDRIYKCLECGQTTFKYNEGQCPYCKTLDSLYEVGYYSYDEEEELCDLIDDDNEYLIEEY